MLQTSNSMAIIINLAYIEKLLGKEEAKKAIVKRVKGKVFVFDEESYKEFKKFEILYHIEVNDGYLEGEKKGDPDNYIGFHVWLMKGEVQSFKRDAIDKVNVHHLTFCKRINIKKFLRVVTRQQHLKLHGDYFGHGWKTSTNAIDNAEKERFSSFLNRDYAERD